MMRHIAPIAQQLRHLKYAPRPAMFHSHEEQELTAGQRIAEQVASRVGSWGFIGAQAVILTLWAVINSLAIFSVIHWDAYPFILMNLFMSAEAAFTGPILLIAANVGAQRDHKQADRVEQLLRQNEALTERIEALLEKQPRKQPRRKAS
jgi:uncharacterized membrane protein